jgi:ubiquinone/menaquinone biosynthesis C-methylase UbiE
MKILKLNLGCGPDLRPGYLNVDDGSMFGFKYQPGVQFWNLNVFPWPFESDSADEILMWHVLEHLPETARVLAEIKRVLKPGGLFWGQVPYGPSHDGRTQWQHCRYFVARSFAGMAEDFNFKLLLARNAAHSTTWRHRVRNLVPCRETLALAGWSEAFDIVDFKLAKN